MKHTVRYLFGLNGQYSMFANRKDLSVHLPRTGQGSCHKWQQMHVEIHSNAKGLIYRNIFKCILKLENCSIKDAEQKKTLLKHVKKNHIFVGYTPVICKSLITLNIRLQSCLAITSCYKVTSSHGPKENQTFGTNGGVE